MGDRDYQMAPPMRQEMEPPMQSQGYEGRPEEYGMQPYEQRPEMGDPNDPNSPAALAAKAHKKKSKWWIYVLVGLGCLVGLVLVMGILNQVAKDGSSIAKSIFSMAKYLAYAAIIFTALAALGKFALKKVKEDKGDKGPGDPDTSDNDGKPDSEPDNDDKPDNEPVDDE